jgi:hypothetical protein
LERDNLKTQSLEHHFDSSKAGQTRKSVTTSVSYVSSLAFNFPSYVIVHGIHRRAKQEPKCSRCRTCSAPSLALERVFRWATGGARQYQHSAEKTRRLFVVRKFSQAVDRFCGIKDGSKPRQRAIASLLVPVSVEDLSTQDFPPEDGKCSICKEKIGSCPESGEKGSPIKLPCGHIFGEICITAWLNGNKSSCPFCRRKYDLRPLH